MKQLVENVSTNLCSPDNGKTLMPFGAHNCSVVVIS